MCAPNKSGAFYQHPFKRFVCCDIFIYLAFLFSLTSCKTTNWYKLDDEKWMRPNMNFKQRIWLLSTAAYIECVRLFAGAIEHCDIFVFIYHIYHNRLLNVIIVEFGMIERLDLCSVGICRSFFRNHFLFGGLRMTK